MKEVLTMMTYENWKKDTVAEESRVCKEAVRLAEFVKTCYHVETAVRNPEANWLTTPMNEMYISIANQTPDQLDSLYRELEDMTERVRKLMDSIATLSDVRRELAETTAEDFED